MFKPLRGIIAVITVLMCNSNIAQSFTDPTRPASFTNQKSTQAFRLESVLIGPSRAVAVINGKVVKVGDVIGDNKVIAISRNNVTLANSNNQFNLTLADAKVNNVKHKTEQQ